MFTVQRFNGCEWIDFMDRIGTRSEAERVELVVKGMGLKTRIILS